MTTALVVGKFYPPHAGHHELIDAAARAADRVVVCVLAASHESIPMDLRAAWLRERHPQADVRAAIDDHPIDYDDPRVYDLWERTIRETMGRERADVFFSSEPAYGDEIARRLGAVHVRRPGLDGGAGVPARGS